MTLEHNDEFATEGAMHSVDDPAATSSNGNTHRKPVELSSNAVHGEASGADVLDGNASASTDGRTKPLNSGPTREAVDDAMMDECRRWVADVVGDAYNAEVLQKENFVDSLRSGVVLLVLLQKLDDPPVPDSELRVPKRVDGFFARDNVAKFLRQAAKKFNLTEIELFTDSDLCDGKNDRAVITCLLSIARTAYSRGNMEVAPASIVQQQELSVRIKQAALNQLRKHLAEEGKEDGKGEISKKLEPVAQEEMSHTPCENIPESGEPMKEIKNEVDVEAVVNESLADTEDYRSVEESEEADLPDVPQHGEQMRVDEVADDDKSRPSGTYETTTRHAPVRVRIEGRASDTIKLPQHRTIRATKESQGVAITPVPHQVEQEVNAPQPRGMETQRHGPTAPPAYRPRRWDKIDILLSVVVNAHFTQHPDTNIRFRRLSGNTGEYMVFHKVIGGKKLLHARTELGKVVVGEQRKKGNIEDLVWTDLSHWLERHERDFSN
ncbi:hypothetical protein, conserved [Trypanosoma brucei gambiense DAL972]|uniref:Calponin-homology (CH) domain-containing protein n=1 Tax=Trypanosoma brucei gambiense (strain MHOM/CI/86/DAL972) TaxID=679716 RepID=D0A8W3_TRYB9|nr:hypothetical protein, conserved [Trypanosoma brucei gambiense DAL972]CBH18114.1 hypothetical protein, conserved [Trypanosoma brucei gambiense DAL972]|eukprot:XP_011780378.1 hypothetical protein, conserved [Trypanosoma brucei gambiense DAL972]